MAIYGPVRQHFFSDFVIFPTQKLWMVFENVLHLI
jgi:hypothetical protein